MFYDMFIKLCKEKNVTPVQVRNDLGISQSTMASWKSRGLTPKYSTLKKLADYFGVSVNTLAISSEDTVRPYYGEISGSGEQRIQAIQEKDPTLNRKLDSINLVNMKLEYAQRVTDRHLELMDDSDAFLMVYNDCLNDDGKREVHKYTEYLITRKEFLKPGISSLPDNSPDRPNPSGQKEAVKRVEELAEIPRYQKEKNPADGD